MIQEALREPIRYDQIPNGCWPACLAGLTGIPHEALCRHVPADQSFLTDDSAWKVYYEAVVGVLHAHGWTTQCVGARIPRGFAIGIGKSPSGVDHAVIVHDGALWHDPNVANERAGVERFTCYEIVIPIIGFLETNQ